jgi:hypothetical protein
LARHSVPAPATTTPEGVVYLVGGVAVDVSCPSSEGLLGGLRPGRGSGRLRWSSLASLHRVLALLLLEALLSFGGRVLGCLVVVHLGLFSLCNGRGCNKLSSFLT